MGRKVVPAVLVQVGADEVPGVGGQRVLHGGGERAVAVVRHSDDDVQEAVHGGQVVVAVAVEVAAGHVRDVGPVPDPAQVGEGAAAVVLEHVDVRRAAGVRDGEVGLRVPNEVFGDDRVRAADRQLPTNRPVIALWRREEARAVVLEHGDVGLRGGVGAVVEHRQIPVAVAVEVRADDIKGELPAGGILLFGPERAVTVAGQHGDRVGIGRAGEVRVGGGEVYVAVAVEVRADDGLGVGARLIVLGRLVPEGGRVGRPGQRQQRR